MTTPAWIDKLPLELVEIILSFVQFDGDLTRCARVRKQWTEPALKLVYREIWLENDFTATRLLEGGMLGRFKTRRVWIGTMANEQEGPLYHTFDVDWCDEFTEVLKSCRELEVLCIADNVLDTQTTLFSEVPFPHLKYMSLACAFDAPREDATTPLPSLPLPSLSFLSVGFDPVGVEYRDLGLYEALENLLAPSDDGGLHPPLTGLWLKGGFLTRSIPIFYPFGSQLHFLRIPLEGMMLDANDPQPLFTSELLETIRIDLSWAFTSDVLSALLLGALRSSVETLKELSLFLDGKRLVGPTVDFLVDVLSTLEFKKLEVLEVAGHTRKEIEDIDGGKDLIKLVDERGLISKSMGK